MDRTRTETIETDPGYQVISVWDSLASFARFRDEQLNPALEAEGVPPEHLTTTTFEATSYMAGEKGLVVPEEDFLVHGALAVPDSNSDHVDGERLAGGRDG
jgi:hypothetical protein